MATEVRWADGQAILSETTIRWADGGVYQYYEEAAPAATEYRMIYHNHYWQMRMV